MTTPVATAKIQDGDTPIKDLETLRKGGKEHVQTFNAHDANALSAFWSPDAVYINRLTGEQVIGRDQIAKQFAAMFEAKQGLQMDIDVQS